MKMSFKTKLIVVVNVILLLASISIFAITSVNLASFEKNAHEENIQYALDVEYQKEISEARSNFEISQINLKYAKKWSGKAEHYYQQIIDYYETTTFHADSQEMIEKTKEAKVQWEKNYASEKSYYESFMLSVYTSGSIVPIKLSEFEYTSYRACALELSDMCRELHIPDLSDTSD
ncbi:MAG: hypothetical protein E7533_00190 [Ruminococcaceae bacterium]|nr:hypothetical protein [Oscillospiraceae bacterium]